MKGLWIKEERFALTNLHQTFLHKGGTFALKFINSNSYLKLFSFVLKIHVSKGETFDA